jgi:two-component system LytT family sensor kinase
MIVSLAWTVPALLGAVDALAQHHVWGGPPLQVNDVLFSGGDWLLYALFTPVIFALSRRLPLARPHLWRNALVHVVLSLAFCVAWASAGTLLKLVLQPNSFGGGIARFYASWIFTTLPFGVAVYLFVVGIEHAIRYFAENRDREMQLVRVSSQLTTARLSALQARLNPHFLFNSLNTIAVLVRDGDGPRATRVIEQLSDVLRHTLHRSRANEVTVADELDLVRQYLAVESARFSDRLRAEFDVDATVLSAAVPSFALQHLVENAVRHGIARRTEAERISVSARRRGNLLELAVADDGPGLVGSPDVEGHGIENTRERLRTLYGSAASLTVVPLAPGPGTIARLLIPYHDAPQRDVNAVA